jgi:hypothetical protein
VTQRSRNFLIILAGCVLLGAVIGWIDRSGKHEALTAPMRIVPPPVAKSEPRAPPKIFRMEATLEELRKFPTLDGMDRADEAALAALPRGLEVAGQWVKADDVLEGYAHPNGKRFFVIMKPGDRAYSVFVE